MYRNTFLSNSGFFESFQFYRGEVGTSSLFDKYKQTKKTTFLSNKCDIINIVQCRVGMNDNYAIHYLLSSDCLP